MSRLQRLAGGLLPGATARRSQIERHAQEWATANIAADGLPGPVWAVLGDSTAQAIGASSIGSGYVGGVGAWLSARDGVTWNVLNISRSGARVADVLDEQLPLLQETTDPALVSCAIGVNDLLRRTADLETKFDLVAQQLPPGSLLANLPRGLHERRAAQLNQHLANLTRRYDLRLVDLWAVTGPPWRGRYSADQFHPNDAGYSAWTRAFITTLSGSDPEERL